MGRALHERNTMSGRWGFDWRDALAIAWIAVVFGAHLWMMARFLAQFP